MAENMQVNALLGFAILFVILAVTISLGSEVLTDMQDTQRDDSTGLTTGNQSFSWPGNDTLVGFVENRVITSSLVMYCNTTTLTLNQNYSVQTYGVKVLNLSSTDTGIGSNIQDCNFNMSYDYSFGSYQRNISGYGLTTQNTIGKWIPTIALILVISVIIGVLLMYLAYSRFQ